jgi:hypothetical protein
MVKPTLLSTILVKENLESTKITNISPTDVSFGLLEFWRNTNGKKGKKFLSYGLAGSIQGIS